MGAAQDKRRAYWERVQKHRRSAESVIRNAHGERVHVDSTTTHRETSRPATTRATYMRDVKAVPTITQDKRTRFSPPTPEEVTAIQATRAANAAARAVRREEVRGNWDAQAGAWARHIEAHNAKKFTGFVAEGQPDQS
ncbi:hypothetical protein [Burkholderia cepacia]|uniref:hypothetical protein n=1 Tax=Burkholderia cepacia TaxID=292 RepID=UPI000AE2BFF2|nr:hypothetical protein [Burkholderia cepacia]